MPRVKGGVQTLKRRRKVLKRTKGYRFGRSKKEAQATEAMLHAGAHAFAHRRDKKNDYRRLWQVKINAAVRPLGYSYSKFISALKKKGVTLDRKVLADLAENKPASFERLVKSL